MRLCGCHILGVLLTQIPGRNTNHLLLLPGAKFQSIPPPSLGLKQLGTLHQPKPMTPAWCMRVQPFEKITLCYYVYYEAVFVKSYSSRCKD